jgi:uncharacterized protein (PEP-CTERM system associated)
LIALSSSLIGNLARAAEPEGGAAPQQALVLQPSVELQETYTDNVALTAQDKVSDFITRVLLSLEGTLDTARSEGKVDASVGYDAYARQTFRSGWYAYGNGSASYAIVPDLLTLAAAGSTTEGAISAFGVSATDRRGAPNLLQQTTYYVGPELTGHTPDGWDVKAAARFAQVFYSNASSGPLTLPSNDSIGQIVGDISSDATRRLQLENSGEYLHDTRSFVSVNDIQSAYYRLSDFRLIGRVGYDVVTQDHVLHISAPLASAGFEYKPNSTSTITVESGVRYNRPAWAADATIEISPRLLATASYVEQVQPDQVWVARSYFGFTQAAQKLPPPLVPATFGVPLNLANVTSFNRTANFRGVYHDDVNNFSVTTGWNNSEYLTTPGQARSLLVNATYSRRVHPDLTLMLSGNYAYTPESTIYGSSQSVGESVQLAYRMNSHTDVTLNFSQTQNRQLVPVGERVTEAAVFVTLRRTL